MLLVTYGEGGKILFWSPFGSKSTKICYMPMLEELARRGHEITVVHPHKSKQATKWRPLLAEHGKQHGGLLELKL